MIVAGNIWFGIYTLAVGLVVAGLALRGISRGLRSHGWPTVVGRVLDARLEQESDGPYHVLVEFAYDAGGRTHTRTQMLEVWMPRREKAERLRAGYPRDAEVSVRYDPTKPSVGVIRTGVSVGLWAWAIAGAVVVASGVALLAGRV